MRTVRRSATSTESKVTQGGRELRAYVDELGMSVPDFCDVHGLDRIQVQRVMNGDRWKRISVDFAFSIDKATKGRVPWTSFLSKTARQFVAKSKAA